MVGGHVYVVVYGRQQVVYNAMYNGGWTQCMCGI